MALAHAHEWDFVGGVSLLGIGFAFAFSSMGNLIVDAVEPEDVGIATGMNTIVGTVGGAFGAAVTAAILAASTIPGTHLPHASDYRIAFLVVAAAAVIAAAVTLGLPRASKQTAPIDGKLETPPQGIRHNGASVAAQRR